MQERNLEKNINLLRQSNETYHSFSLKEQQKKEKISTLNLIDVLVSNRLVKPSNK